MTLPFLNARQRSFEVHPDSIHNVRSNGGGSLAYFGLEEATENVARNEVPH